LVSPVNGNGQAHLRCADTDGVWLQDARRRKERTYPELTNGSRCKLVVLALELSGRWSTEAVNFVHLPARAKAREAAELLRNDCPGADGAQSWRSLLRGRSPLLCSSFPPAVG
jgi:hypothetical protein